MTSDNLSTDAAPAADAAAKPPAVNSRFRLAVVLIVGTILIAALSFGVYKLRAFVDSANADGAPLPRVPLNAPFIKTPNAIALKMIGMAKVTEKDLVYDLGCGDGRLVITAAAMHGCRGVGFDIEPQRIVEAKENARQNGVEHLVTFREQDIFEVDLGEADVVVMYLLPWMLEKLIPQFDKCKPGTRLVSHDFWIEGVEATESIEVDDQEGDTRYIHLYVTPLKKLPEKRWWKLKKKNE